MADWGGNLIRFTLEQGSKLLHSFAKPANRLGLEILSNISYTESGMHEHFLDIYRPANLLDKAPCMLYIHGGGFKNLSKDTHWMINRKFAAAGLVVFSINYRLAPDNQFPAALEDAAMALTWLLKNGKYYHADTSKIFLAGESAGANLALSLLVAMANKKGPFTWSNELYKNRKSVIGALPACGILQVSNPGRFITEGVSEFVSNRIKSICHSYLPEALYSRPDSSYADPLVLIEKKNFDKDLPPIFTFAGKNDPILSDTIRLKEALENHGQPCEAMFYEDAGHAFHALTWLEQSRHCWNQQLEFIHNLVELHAD